MSTPVTAGGADIADSVGAAYQRIVGVEGASSASAVAKLFRFVAPGFADNQFLAAGATTLTASHFKGQILAAINPADSVLALPLMATLGLPINSDGTARPYLRYEVLGLGRLFINLADVTQQKIVWNGQDPQFFTQFSGVGLLKFCGVDAADSKETWVAG